MYYKFDVVIVGSGGAGLMAAMQLPNASVAVLSKVYPTRVRIRAQLRAALRRPWEIAKKTTGSGTCTIP